MTILHESETFRLESWHNGLSYNLTHKPSQKEYFCQGDDAASFDDERENVEKYFPEKSTDDVLMWLWDQCELSLASTPVKPIPAHRS